MIIKSKGAVVINKTTSIGNQYGDGIDVDTLGAITVSGITAGSNGWSGTTGKGAILDNVDGTGAVSVLSTLGKNTFSMNQTVGLDVSSKGAVVINSTTANLNSNGAGINVDNHLAVVAETGTVTVTGVLVQQNAYGGISIASNGIAALTGVEAIDNGNSSVDESGIKIATNGYNALVQSSITILNGQHVYANVGSAT